MVEPARYQKLRRSAVAQAVALAAAAFLLRALHLRFIAGSPLFQAPTTDEFEHWDLAGKLAAGNWLGYGLGPYFRPQLFAYFLAVLRRLTGGSLPLIHLILALLDATTIGVLYLAARRIWPRRTAAVGAMAAAVYWPLLYFSATLNKESFAIHLQAWMLLTLILWTRGLQRHRPSGRAPLIIGLLAGLGLLCRPALFLPFFGMLITMVILARRRGAGPARALQAPAIVAAVALACLVPQVWRNFTAGGAPIVYSTNGWLNLYLANNGEGASWQEYSPGIAWDLFVERPKIDGGVAEEDYAGINAYWRNRFLGYVVRQPFAFLSGIAAKSAAVLNAREVGVTNSFGEMARLSPIQRWLPGTGMLFPLALVGVAAWLRGKPSRRLRRDAGILLLTFAVLSLLATAIVFPVTRDRLPAMALLLLFVGPGVSALLEAAQGQRPQERAACLIALALAVAVVHWPLPDAGLERFDAWMTETNRGSALAQLWKRDHQPEELSAAMAANEQALRIRPEGLQPLLQLPPLYWQAGRADDALAPQERLVARLRQEYGRNVSVRARELGITGRLALRAGHPERAAAAAQEWRALGVRTLAAMDLQAVALAAQGKLPEARAVAEDRMRRAPGDPEGAHLLETLRQVPPDHSRRAPTGEHGIPSRPESRSQ